MNSVLIRKKWIRIKGSEKKTNIPKTLAARSHIVVLQRGQCSAIFVGNLRPGLNMHFTCAKSNCQIKCM